MLSLRSSRLLFRRRAAPLLVGLLAGCVYCQGAQAQSLRDLLPKLNQLMPNPAQNRQNQQQAERDKLEARCKALVDWAGAASSQPDAPNRPAPRMSPAVEAQQQARLAARNGGGKAAPSATMRLFADEQFKPVFGKAFDELSPSERLAIYNDQFLGCQRSPTYANAVRMLMRTVAVPFQDIGGPMAVGGMSAAQVTEAVRHMRGAGGNLQTMLAELQALPATPDGWSAFLVRKPQADEAVRFLQGSEQAAAQEAIHQAGARLANVALAALVQETQGLPDGPDALPRLREAGNQLKAMEPFADPAQLAGARSALGQRRGTLVRGALAQEQQRLDALPANGSGLDAGVAWYREVQRKFDDEVKHEREYQRLMTDFRSKRNGQLAALQPALLGQLRAAKSSADMAATISGVLVLPGDVESPTGQEMKQVALAREESLRKAQVLGSQMNEAPAAAAQGGGHAAPAAPVATGGGGGSMREPTASEMYDLIQSRFDAIARDNQEQQADCKRGVANNNDPGRAIVCMGAWMNGAAGAGEPMRITKFEKLGCDKASGKAGYVCDYMLAYAGGPQKAMGPTLAALMGRGGAAQGRFLKTRDGWIAFFGEK